MPIVLEKDMQCKMVLKLKCILPNGKNTEEVQDQEEINKWQKYAIMLFVFGMEKSKGTKSMIDSARNTKNDMD